MKYAWFYSLFYILASFMIISCSHLGFSQKQLMLARLSQREGEVLLQQHEYTAALSRFISASKILSDDPILLNSLGLAYMGKGKNELARDTFAKAVKIQPDYKEAINNLGAAYLRMEKWDKAINIFSGLAEDLLYSTPHYALANMGWAYLGKGNFDLAFHFFQKSLSREPDFVAGTHGLIQTYIKTGRNIEALAYVKACLQIAPETAIYYADLAQIHENMGQFICAKVAWAKVRELVNPSSNLAAKARVHLYKLNLHLLDE